ncbi:MAG: CinA family nicotinamide mononucleotide deamidase-related protein [Nitriliruptoraceae bacterium]|nr:CinA family nicotinamide mononucleotide deamidase-related protein [Nitriliruptoraceae bacterium]
MVVTLGPATDGLVLEPTHTPPCAAVLSVGSELLLGDLTDTNATWISQRLKEQGVAVVHHLAVRDDLDELVAALRWLAARVHLVIVGGGLGPTVDDLTREAVAAAADVALDEHPELVERIAARFAEAGMEMPPANLKQARIPRGADVFPPVGTAPAFAMTLLDPNPTRVVALPGVPWELKQLWDRHVVAEVTAIAGHRVTVTRVLHVVGRGESDVAAVVEPMVGGRDDVTLAFLARSSEIEVRLTVSADDRDGALAASQPLVEEVSAALEGAVAAVDDESLEQAVIRQLIAAGQTIATAESATAGGIAARLASVAGASAALVGGAVVYAIDAKHDLLDVPHELLAAHGSVSGPVTEELARRVKQRTGADWAIAVTGVAGPGTVDDLPVGTCVWALAHPDGEVEVHTRRIPGDRAQVLGRLGTAAIDLLRRRLAMTD